MTVSNTVIKTACLVLNGDVDSYDYLKESISKNDYDLIVAVDGGANHLYKIGIIPNIIVGDLDSISEDARDYFSDNNVGIKKFPSKKDETDSELAIISSVEYGCKKIDLYSSLGGRVDHQIANINLLYYILKKGCIPRILTKSEELYIVKDGEILLDGEKDDKISILPINGDACGVTLENLEYTLNNFDLEFASPRGVSNVMLDSSCRISVKDGSLLVIKTNKTVK